MKKLLSQARRTLSRLLIASLFVCFPRMLAAQEWTTSLPLTSSSLEEAVELSGDGHDIYLAASRLNNRGNWDAMLARLDAEGDTVWVRCWDHGGNERSVQLLSDRDGGVYLAATRWSPDGSRAFLLRWNAQGQLLWERAFKDGSNRTSAVGIAIAGNNSAVLTFASQGYGGSRTGLACIEADGEQRWAVFAEGGIPRCVAVGNGVIAVAQCNGDNPVFSTALFFTDDGQQFAASTYAGAGAGRTLPTVLRADRDGFYLAGNALDEAGNGLPYILRYSLNGEKQWCTFPFETPGHHRLVDLQTFPGGGTVVAAREQTAEGNADMFLARLSADGRFLWRQRYDRTGSNVDESRPQFGGLMGASLMNDHIGLCWSPARDDISLPDDIRYNIYVATRPGEQDYSSPSSTVTGSACASIAFPSGSMQAYVVVRALDEGGNEDANTAEIPLAMPTFTDFHDYHPFHAPLTTVASGEGHVEVTAGTTP